jgi:hypothetical protein
MKKIVFAFILLLVLASATTPARLLAIIAPTQQELVQQQGPIKSMDIDYDQGMGNGLRVDPGTIPPVDPSRCRAGQVLTPSGCWNSCSDPKYK